MAQDTLLGFPAHTLPYRCGEFTTLSTVSLPPVSRRESQRIEKVCSPRCGGTDLPCRRFHGFKAAYSPSRRFSIVTIWARVQRACGISRLSAPLRIAAFTAHVMASSA